ncbi:MAG TPA: DUF488 family protein [Caulobacteraceae bacterium]
MRAVAASRRPGFSKTILAASLSEAGLAYRHPRALGTAKSGRDAAIASVHRPPAGLRRSRSSPPGSGGRQQPRRSLMACHID